MAVVATAAAWLPPVVFGLRWADYRASRDFISELGAAGAPDAAVVNLSFLAAGALFVATLVLMARGLRGRRVAVLGLVSCVGWSYVVAAFVPCDAGCPASGSPAQTLHNAVGGLGYLAGAAGLLMAARVRTTEARAPGWLSLTAGLIVFATVFGMGAPELAGVRGALQRLGEAAVFTWLLVEASAVERTSRS